MCRSQLVREYDIWIVRTLQMIFARTAEIGSRTILYGAGAGLESHGKYALDCKITPYKGLCEGTAGAQLADRVWAELRDILEDIDPGVTALS
jgi:hypothetical protein